MIKNVRETMIFRRRKIMILFKSTQPLDSIWVKTSILSATKKRLFSFCNRNYERSQTPNIACQSEALKLQRKQQK